MQGHDDAPQPVPARLSTGIDGFDTILGGGLIERGLYIVRGMPGTGKTILGNQIAYHRAALGERVLFFTLLAEPHDRMLEHLQGMSFADPEAVPGRLSYLSAYGALDEDGAAGLLRLLQESLRRKKPRLILLDGLYIARERAQGSRDLRHLLYQLQVEAAANDCTMLFLTNGPLGEFSPEFTMVDGIVELLDDVVDGRAIRQIQVAKLRGGAHLQGRHVFTITTRGIAVWPRLEQVVEHRPHAMPDGRNRIGSGIPDLDALLHGGLPGSATTLVVGPSGSGKTSAGLMFLGESTPESPGLLLGCYETAEELCLKAANLGVDLEGLMRSGAVRLLRYLPFESHLDEIGHGLLQAAREFRPKRVFIDGVGALEQAGVPASRTEAVFSALSMGLRTGGAAVMCTAEARELFFPSELVLSRISPVAENLVLLRLAEHESRLMRFISVIKVRQSGFDPSIHPFEIHDRGIRLLPRVDRAEDIIRGASSWTAPGRSA